MSRPSLPTRTTTVDEWRGPVLEVVQQLVAGQENARAVLAIFAKLVERNSELERKLTEFLSRQHKNEGVSTSQLLLFLSNLEQPSSEAEAEPGALVPCSPAAEEANSQLRAASGIDQCGSGTEPAKPPPQPSVRKPFPAHLERVPQVIPVPKEQRACPVCGKERQCFGHDVTEVADLKPAEIFIRLEKREKLACENCEDELVRAPVGDRVVSGGVSGRSWSGSF